MGTPRAITRPSDNAVVWKWDNTEPFGANLPNEDPANTGTAFKYNLRFPGQYADVETGTHYNMMRDYDPRIGRYVQSDPIGLRGGISIYAYVANAPLSMSDVLGLRPLNVCEKTLLGPYIPLQDLESADLHDGEVPFYLGKDFAGITRGNDIYFRPGVYDDSLASGVALLGHELVHVGQYREGMTWLSYLWSTRAGYRDSKYEKPAYDLQSRIQSELTDERVKEIMKGCKPCKQTQ